MEKMIQVSKWKKGCSSFLTGLLVVSLLAGCAKTEPAKDKTTNPESTQTQTKETVKPTLRYLGPNIKEDPNKRYEAAAIEKLTGYKVNYELLPQDKPEEKLNLIIASGEQYDIITAGGGLKEYMMEFARKGAVVELDPMLDKYAPRVKQVISEKSFNFFKVQNKTYFIPSKIALEYINMGLLIRQDWVEKLGTKTPKTLDEFTNMLRAFKEKDPGNNTDKNIPLTTSNVASMHGLMGAFGIANGWNEVDGKLVAREEMPGFKEYLEYMAGLYKEGLLDKEFPVNKATTVTEKFGSGRVGVINQNSFSVGPVVEALKKAVPDAKYAYLEPLIGKNGQQGVAQTAGYDYLTFIPKASKYPTDAIKWVNLKLEEKIFKESTIGEEGVHHKFKDGVYSSILPKFNDDFGYGYYFLTGTDEKAYGNYWMARLQRDMINYEEFTKLQKGVGKWSKLDVSQLATNVPNFTKNETSLNTMTNNFMTKVIAGGEPLSAIDAYIKKWREAGGDTSTKEINEWYKQYLQMNK